MTRYPNTVERLRALKLDTDDAIGKIEATGQCEGAINWADLSCHEAMHIVNDDGHEYDEVLIEEASPDATELQKRVGQELKLAGWDDISVRTEW